MAILTNTTTTAPETAQVRADRALDVLDQMYEYYTREPRPLRVAPARGPVMPAPVVTDLLAHRAA